MRNLLVGLVVASAILGIEPGVSAQTAPPPFAMCNACHAVTPDGATRVGPNLRGVVGRKAGSLPGFTYSAAMKGAGITWTKAQLDAFLTSPQKLVPHTYMSFPGQPDPVKRQQIIAYLASLK